MSLKISETFSIKEEKRPKWRRHLHLQEKVSQISRNCFSCVQPFCHSCKRTHLHKKLISPTIKGWRWWWDQPFGSNWLSNANNLLAYANDIRKNWHSGGLKSRKINLNCKFFRENFFGNWSANWRTFLFFQLQMGARKNSKIWRYYANSTIRINDYGFTLFFKSIEILKATPEGELTESWNKRRTKAGVGEQRKNLLRPLFVIRCESAAKKSWGELSWNDMPFTS